jgi:hypothetical protein
MWNLLPGERLRCWQDFRKSISQKSFEDALKDTQHLWSFAPYMAHYLTTDHVEEWPGPWELIYENYYCDLAKALGIVYTLYLSDHRPELEIKIYSEPSTKEQYNLVFVDKGKYVLNLIHDEVVNKAQIGNDLKLIKTLRPEDLGLNKIQ